MDTNKYQQYASHTINPELSWHERVAMCGLGLAGETGETCDMLKKYLYHSKDISIDTLKLTSELGDILWYLTVLASQFDITLDAIMEHNISKLAVRHPHGFQTHYESDSGTSARREVI